MPNYVEHLHLTFGLGQHNKKPQLIHMLLDLLGLTNYCSAASEFWDYSHCFNTLERLYLAQNYYPSHVRFIQCKSLKLYTYKRKDQQKFILMLFILIPCEEETQRMFTGKRQEERKTKNTTKDWNSEKILCFSFIVNIWTQVKAIVSL